MFGKTLFVNEGVHGNDWGVTRFYPTGKIPFQKREDKALHCSYCGSLHPKDALVWLQSPDAHASGSDWKYGWPHKFYIDANGNWGKFYSMHLKDADEQTFKELTEIISSKLGITFSKDERGLKYSAAYGGFQTWFPDLNNEAPKIP